jgi:SagB-type dehydrogenase family enzyme
MRFILVAKKETATSTAGSIRRLMPRLEPVIRIETGEKIPLPEPASSAASLDHCLRLRRSCRSFREAPLTLREVARVLWAAQGITGLGGLRTAPSAGALYPLRAYLVAADIRELEPAVYLYDVDERALAVRSPGDLRQALAAAANDQACLGEAPAIVLLAANFKRAEREFGERGRRLAYIEAGHVAQNVLLQATALSLGAIGLGVFDDGAVKQLMALPAAEDPVCLIALGHRL